MLYFILQPKTTTSTTTTTLTELDILSPPFYKQNNPFSPKVVTGLSMQLLQYTSTSEKKHLGVSKSFTLFEKFCQTQGVLLQSLDFVIFRHCLIQGVIKCS